MTTASRPSPAEMDLLSDVIRQVARAHRVPPEDADDFIQTVHLRMLERQYDVFERFSGRSSLRTYLTVVVTRLLLDWRNSVYGKWRPSAAARRLGEEAVRIERLIVRDGYSASEAVELMCSEDLARSRSELEALADRIPVRHRRRLVPDDTLAQSLCTAFDDPVAAEECATQERRVRAALATAMKQLSTRDRRLIALRYARGCSVKTASVILQVEPKTLYRQMESVMRRLRRTLAAAGVSGVVGLETHQRTLGWRTALEESA